MTADVYLHWVGRALRDLPWKVRRDLLAELEDHLSELPPDTNLVERLGSPEQYAADMRAAAGLDRRRGPIAFLRAHRLRNLIAIVVLLTAIGLAIGAVAWIDSYQPISFGGMSVVPIGAKGVTGVQGESVVFHEGKPFQFGIDIHNSGRYPVRVLSVPLTGPNPWTARLLLTTPQNGTDSQTYERFHPFTLKPRQYVFLVFKGVFACHTGTALGSAATYSDFPLRYRFLWRTTTISIPLHDPLAIIFRTSCPPPTG